MKVFCPDKINKELAIIMPAYNEEQAISQVLAEWSEIASKGNGTLVVINDGSRDHTLEILREGMGIYHNLVVIDKSNSGHASSCLAGYHWVEENDFKWVFQTDSDGQTKGSEFMTIWKDRDSHDFIFGFRPWRGDGFGRLVISRILRMVIFLVFGVFVKDANVPFRLMRVHAVIPFLPKVNPDLFLGNAFLAVVIQKYSKIKWVQISFSPRKGGSPSVAWRRFFAVGLKVIAEFWRARREIA